MYIVYSVHCIVYTIYTVWCVTFICECVDCACWPVLCAARHCTVSLITWHSYNRILQICSRHDSVFHGSCPYSCLYLTHICFFIKSALWADSVSKLQCSSVVWLCFCVCAIAETPLPGGLVTSGGRVSPVCGFFCRSTRRCATLAMQKSIFSLWSSSH